MKKINLIKRLTNQAFNLQSMAFNAFIQFLKSEIQREIEEENERKRIQHEKDRILRRILDSNLRILGLSFRQSAQFAESEAEKERQLVFRQRGIIRKITDSQFRIMGQFFNQLQHFANYNNILLKKNCNEND